MKLNTDGITAENSNSLKTIIYGNGQTIQDSTMGTIIIQSEHFILNDSGKLDAVYIVYSFFYGVYELIGVYRHPRKKQFVKRSDIDRLIRDEKQINADEKQIREFISDLHKKGTLPFEPETMINVIMEMQGKNQDAYSKLLKKIEGYEKDSFFTVELMPVKSMTEYKDTKNYFVSDGNQSAWNKVPASNTFIPVIVNDSFVYISCDEGKDEGFLCWEYNDDLDITGETSENYGRNSVSF